MRTTILALAASTLLASPALAQNQDGQTGNQAGSTQQTQQMQRQGDMATGCAARREAMGRGQGGGSAQTATLTSASDVRSALEENGLSNVNVLQASYVVEATAPNGDCALMIIDAERRAMGRMAGGSGQSGMDSDDRQTQASGQSGMDSDDRQTQASGQSGMDSDDRQTQASDQSGMSDIQGKMARKYRSGEEMTRGQRRAEGESFAAELKAAGYSDIRVIDAAFGATATLEGGEPVMLMVEGTPAGDGEDGSETN